MPVHAVLDRSGKDLPVGEVLVPVAVDPLPACDFQFKVGILADDMDLFGLVQPINDALLLSGDCPPGLDWISLIDQASLVD
jgi:hypothetical protein